MPHVQTDIRTGMPITIIEGFGDEVILVASSLLVLCLTVVASWKLWLRLQGPIAIHPANERDVAEARRHLGVHDENGQPRARRILGDEPCPICLVRPNFAVSTNCGHVFCGKQPHWKALIAKIVHVPECCVICSVHLYIEHSNFFAGETDIFIIAERFEWAL